MLKYEAWNSEYVSPDGIAMMMKQRPFLPLQSINYVTCLIVGDADQLEVVLR